MPIGVYQRTPDMKTGRHHSNRGRKHSQKFSDDISKRMKGHPVSLETRAKISRANKGMTQPPRSEKFIENLRKRKGELHPYWKGGNNRQWRYKNAPPKPEMCDICDFPAKDLKRGLFLEHNHKTGAIRGWVCVRCNMAIAWLEITRDNPELRKKINDFLDRENKELTSP